MPSDTEIYYRPMCAEDFTAVNDLWQRTEGMGLDPELDSDEQIGFYLAKNPAMSFVACCAESADGERIIGTVLCGTDGRRGYLMHLAVEKDMRRRGVGRALVDKALAALKNAGIRRTHVFVFKDNTAGAEFWRRGGWRGRDDLLMLSMEK